MHIEKTLMKLDIYELLEQYDEIWEKLKIVSKNNLIVNQCIMKRLKQNLIMEKSTQIFTIIKYQEKVLNLLFNQ